MNIYQKTFKHVKLNSNFPIINPITDNKVMLTEIYKE